MDNNEKDNSYLDLEYLKELYAETEADKPDASDAHDKNDNVAVKKDDLSASMGLYDWTQCIVSALICGIFIFMFLGRVIGVIGSSMVPTLHDGDSVITSKLFYEPEYGDIVVVQTTTFGEDPIVKRVIATGGQTVDIDFDLGIVYVDGVALDEDYTNDLTYSEEDFSGPVTIPEGYLFLMGDNRNASTDSRSLHVGLVDERCILGKVYFVIFPGSEESGSRDWSRIGSVYK